MRSVAILTATARPDQIVRVVLAVEEVGEDRCVEARIVELDREIVAALSGALWPGGAISARPTKTRWEGALSLLRLASGTMRTPLACTLSVTISP
jgi:hypothetical protein